MQSLKTYHASGQGQLRLDILSPDEEAAPAPVVRTLRDESVERPSTAPSRRPTTNRPNTSKTQLREGYLSRPLPVSSQSQHGSFRGRKPPLRPYRIDLVSNQHLVEPQSRPCSAYQASNPDSSISGSGFKDILDAQSEFKPLDFKSRLKASGARDYGEDVADRNIGENGRNLELPQVRAFYAQSMDADSLREPRCGSMANIPRPYQREMAAQSDIGKSASLESSPRRQSQNSSSVLKQRQHERVSRMPQPASQKPATTCQDFAQRPKTSDSIPRPLSPSTTANPDAVQVCDSETPKLRRVAHRRRPSSPLTLPHDSLVLSPDRSCPAQPDERPSSQRSLPPMPSKRGRSGTTASAVCSAEGYTTHSSKPSIASSIATYHTAIDTTTRAYPMQLRALGSPNRAKTARRASLPLSPLIIPDSHDVRPTRTPPSPYMKPGSARYEPSSVYNNRRRTISLTSSFREVDTGNLPEVVPPRTSSLRKWSISSTTLSTSDTSSNSFHRPQSRNTATTSVDLGKESLPPNPAPQPKLGDAPNPPLSPPPPKSPSDIYIDDGPSLSDSDSLEPRIPRGAGEEDLLFSTSGYGTGAQLPGLFDALTSTPPRHIFAVADDSSPPPRPRSSASLPAAAFHNSSPYAGPGPLAPRRRYILDTAADYDSTSSSEDSDDEGEDARTWHGGDARAVAEGRVSSPVRSVRRTRRLSALGARCPAAEVIEEEREEVKIDVAAAVRLRKEEKARVRAAVAAARRKMLGAEERRGVEGDEEADEGGLADVE